MKPVGCGSACRGRAFTLKLLLLVSFAYLLNAAAVDAQQGGPELLTYNELVQLYEQETPTNALQNKLQRLLTIPFVSNTASARGVKPLLPSTAKLGKFLRVVEWNIQRGLEYDAIRSAFTDATRFAKLLDSTAFPLEGEKRKLVLQQVALMKQADVIVLNEVDWGMKRTDYRNVAADLASALGMNYAYGVEFVEVDPIALGLEKFEELPPEDRAKLASEISIDSGRYRGLHGTAILSRFPLENVRLEPFEHQPHDWYSDELKSVKPLEAGKRKAGEIVFQEKVLREVRRGGRMMLTAEIADARISGGRLTVVATHLESKTKPEGRRKQLEELLERIKDTNVPVVVAGDMNTSTNDSTPTSFERELKKRLGSKSFWLKQGLGILTGLKLPTLLLGGLNTYRTQADPTVRSIPLVASNPEAEFFERLKDFRFSDGGTFDFRGERERSLGGKDGPLANSNQRGDKGFITTYEVERTISFVGQFKLDWIFVKPPALTEPYAKEQPHRFGPHFGRTLKSLNDALKDRISDHSPTMVDLPLGEPQFDKSRRETTRRVSPNNFRGKGMGRASQDDATSRSSGNSIWQNERVRRLLLYAAVLLGVFLLGLVPMWMTARSRARERDSAQATLRISTLQNTLANAAVDARRGEYEPARQAASDFFTNLLTEIQRGRDSVFNETQQNTLRPIFDTRDDTITLLARSDPASTERLFDLYNKYRQALGGAPPR